MIRFSDADLLRHRKEALLAYGRYLWHLRPDLREAFEDPDAPGFWVWLQTFGWEDYEPVRELSIGVPPPEVYQHSNTGGERGYLWTGGNTFNMLHRVLESSGVDLASIQSILDFGCGPARGLRLFSRFLPDVRLAGTDVDEVAIEWCRQNFGAAEFQVNAELPPCAFEDDAFDLIYSVSVFSHLSRRSQDAWLPELARISAPGATLVLTVHGPHAAKRALECEAELNLLAIEREELEEAAERMADTGFAFVPQPGGHLTTDLYGVTFVSRKHVESVWTEWFEIDDIHVAAQDDWQDAVVLRARR